jgi:hypothetical protein
MNMDIHVFWIEIAQTYKSPDEGTEQNNKHNVCGLAIVLAQQNYQNFSFWYCM